MTLTDGKTKAVAYPAVGFNCKSDYQLSQKKDDHGPDFKTLQHCPDFDERFTLTDGQTRAIPYPQVGYNCSNEWALNKNKNAGQKMNQMKDDHGPDFTTLQHCPDFDERMTLTDGKTLAIPYPQVGYNCNNEWALNKNKKAGQKLNQMSDDHGPDFTTLQHCPDFDERFTLTDGKTRAIPYPQVGYNCNNEWAYNKKGAKASEGAVNIPVKF